MWKMADRANPKDPFDEADTDGSGGLDQEELEKLTEKLSEIKGKKIDVETVQIPQGDSGGRFAYPFGDTTCTPHLPFLLKIFVIYFPSVTA
jgi:hypothetical protein